MKRLLASLLLGSLLFLASTFAGMAVFGMHGAMVDMDMGMGHCEGVVCSTIPDTTPVGNDCLGHCLAIATSSIASAPSVQNAVWNFVLLLGSFLMLHLVSGARSAVIFERWREGIGKIFLARLLSTVILRN